jgi:hypothetical protein
VQPVEAVHVLIAIDPLDADVLREELKLVHWELLPGGAGRSLTGGP